VLKKNPNIPDSLMQVISQIILIYFDQAYLLRANSDPNEKEKLDQIIDELVI